MSPSEMSENREPSNPTSGDAGATPPAGPPDPVGDQGGNQGGEPGSQKDPEQRIAALETERNELRDRMLRIAAEFDNYKKRVRREQAENENKAREAVLRDLLEVADNLERALAVESSPDIKALQQGVTLVLRLFQNKLERYDVRPLEAKGQPFDPRLHDAISQVPSADAPPGSVLSEVQKGYRIGERLLRPALVVVAVAPTIRKGSSEDGAGGAGGAGSDGSAEG
jgi:molecular chaperone GrpE